MSLTTLRSYVIFAIRILHRGVEQLVARRAHNPKVAGSSPVPATSATAEILIDIFSQDFFIEINHSPTIIVKSRDLLETKEQHCPTTQPVGFRI